MSITKLVTFVAKEENIAELKALLQTMVEPSRAEKGCLLYSIYQMDSKPTTFTVIETWEDDESLKGHQHSDHYRHYKAHFEQYTADKSSEVMTHI